MRVIRQGNPERTEEATFVKMFANGDVLVDNGIFEYRARPVKLYRQLDMVEESALTKKDGL